MQFSLDTLQSEYDALEMCASARGKKLEQDLNEARKEVKGYIDNAFKYFQYLLDESLVQEWNKVVQETCHTKGYVGRGGIRIPDKKRGFCFKSLEACMRAWLLKLKVPKDAAEQIQWYLRSQVRQPERVSVDDYINHLKEINKYLPLLPTIKDLEDVPKQIERADKSFSEPAMCDIILNLIPGSFKEMYYSRKMTHFPVKVDKLQT